MRFKDFAARWGLLSRERDLLEKVIRREWEIGGTVYGSPLIAAISWRSFSTDENGTCQIDLGFGLRTAGYGEVRLDHLSAQQLWRVAAVRVFIDRYMQGEIDELPETCPPAILDLG